MGFHGKCPLFLWDFNKNLNFLERFSKNHEISNFMKIRPLGVDFNKNLKFLERFSKNHEISNFMKIRPLGVDFNKNLKFLERFSNNHEISNFMKIRPLGVDLFHADGQTETTKLTVAFSKY
jgi:hypothetical protein